MSYVLGFIVADGCITVSKDKKKNPFALNITSIDLKHLHAIRRILESDHKISKKSQKINKSGYQLQFRNSTITKDLISLGIRPRKTYNLKPIKIPNKYFPDFVRGFFDGDGTVHVYKVNGAPQIKAGFVSISLSFIREFNKSLCNRLKISSKSIHQNISKNGGMTRYDISFYIDDCGKLEKFMYKNNPVLYLPRKRKVFEEWRDINRRHYIKHNYPSKIGWHLNERVLA